jgi:uncharacterized protein YdiU (UPF0061 family)
MNAVASPAGATIEMLRLSDGYAALGESFVERRDPTPLPEPYLIAFNAAVAELIGLRPDQAERAEFLRLAAGCARFGAVAPFAAVYAGHQFGSFVPQLGDGRAITLGELTTADGRRFEWQIKGGGPTAFSRFGDGRAVLRSTIREYLCSEAMAALGIPTTRALAIAGSDELVFREAPETAAVLTRIAPSHLRFGTFEYFHYRGQEDAVRALAGYAIDGFYPHLAALAEGDRYPSFLREVVERTARLIAQWQGVGFAHGVMNTDNMSILGLTLDYGPYGFLDAYDAGFICNHTDEGGRYSFERQPTIGLWNCRALATALSSLMSKEDAESALAAYEPAFHERYREILRAKFGLAESRPDQDLELFRACFTALQRGRVDYTNFFRALASLSRESTPYDDTLALLFENRSEWDDCLRLYRARLEAEPRDDASRQAAMKRANPKYVLRNYLAQNAIEAATRRDYTELARLHDVLSAPFDERPEDEDYARLPPDWAAGISVSCSS